ncbi:MAG: T9SS type A sorting domain-containing protein [Bacteroidia bacterium]
MKLKIISALLVFVSFVDCTQAQTVYNFAGAGGTGYVNGTAQLAKFGGLEQMAYDKNGNLLVCDAPNHCIRMIDSKGNVSTFAGSGVAGFVNGNKMQAQFNNPLGIAVDNENNVYVSDNLNFVVRKIDAQGNVSTYAGSGEKGYVDGSAAVAKLGYPNYLCVDNDNNLYIADPDNNVIRKVDVLQNVTTFVGSGNAAFTDGVGTAAQLSFPISIAYDKNNNVFYVSDQGNSAIRKVLPDGTLTTYAGCGTIGHTDGDALASKFYFPKGIAVDALGNVYVAGRFDYTVRKIDTRGQVSTVAGTPHVSGNVSGAGKDVKFGKPIEVIVSPEGNLLVSDWVNSTIRKIEMPTTAGLNSITYKNEVLVNVMPNPITTNTVITLEGLKNKQLLNLLVFDVNGKQVGAVNNVVGSKINFERGDLNSGVYFFKIIQNDKVIATDRLVVQ